MCCCDAQVSDFVELCSSVTMNIVLLLGLYIEVYIYREVSFNQIGIFNFILISTNTILVSLELNSFCGKSIKKWNLVMRMIWTLVVGLIVILYLIQLISCTHHGRNACLIWEIRHGDDDNFSVFYSELFFFICLLIVGPMFLYGIFKSFLLHKVLKNMYTYDVSKDFVILN